jgi:hypothetical protein
MVNEQGIDRGKKEKGNKKTVRSKRTAVRKPIDRVSIKVLTLKGEYYYIYNGGMRAFISSERW